MNRSLKEMLENADTEARDRRKQKRNKARNDAIKKYNMLIEVQRSHSSGSFMITDNGKMEVILH